MTKTSNGFAGPDHNSPPAVSEVAFRDGRPAIRVVEAIAKASGVPPMQVRPRLSDVVDPDALDRLFCSLQTGRSRHPGCAAFEMGGWDVVVDWQDELVRVYDSERA